MGNTCERQKGYWSCTGGSNAANGWARAMTIGDVIVTDEKLEPEELRHELGHVAQARMAGLLYLPNYAFYSLASMALDGNFENDCNLMEIEAGPGGGYGACSPGW